MKSNKKTILTGSLIAGAILGLSNLTADASSLTSYSVLGSGAEVRSELLNTNVSPNTFELKCGDSTKVGDSKSKDHKCGEGKCGDKKSSTKTKSTTKETKKTTK